MDLSVIPNWKDDLLPLELISVFGHPWQYRGEGNANIVIALQDSLQVLRLSKVKVGEGTEDWSRQRRKVEREVEFANAVFVPLLGVEYVGRVAAVEIAGAEIGRLSAALRPLRPSFRLHKELRVPFATAHPDFARIHPYPSRRHDYCIEVKPKQGWWPNHLRSTPQCTYCLNQFLKLKRGKITSRTAYCPLDLFSGEPIRIIRAVVALITNPQNNLRIFRDGLLVYGENMNESLDLILEEWILNDPDCDSLSGSETSQKSQEHRSAVSNLIFLLCMALLKPKRVPEGSRFLDLNSSYEIIKSRIRDILCEEAQALSPLDQFGRKETLRSCVDGANALPKGSILSRILDIQKLADIEGGIERIYSLYRNICPVHRKSSQKYDPLIPPGPHKNISSSESGSGEESGSEVESLEEEEVTLREDLPPECPSVKCLAEERWLDELRWVREEVVEVEEYLLAGTAKDCSIMITFSPVHRPPATPDLYQAEREPIHSLYDPTSPSIISYKDSDMILQDLNGTFHRVRIGVADLDPKPVSCIVKHFLRDRDMMVDYKDYLRTQHVPQA